MSTKWLIMIVLGLIVTTIFRIIITLGIIITIEYFTVYITLNYEELIRKIRKLRDK